MASSSSIGRRPQLTPVAAVCAGLMAAAPAFAQQTQQTTEKLDTVTVTGIRSSIESSIALKRNSDSVIEAITAEDIGKLPDVSIADSLSRLPGLAAQRVDGRAQVISIRGMAPRYGTTLLNGREMVSTGDNRSVEYDQFPSELMGSLTVYKTPDAGLVGQGLSGTVNMQTLRPLDLTSRVVAMGLRGEKNSHGKLNPGTKDMGGRFSVSYVDQFADRTVGVAIGYAHLDSPGQEKHYKSWWWADTGVWGSPLGGTPAGSIALQGFEAGVASTRRQRDGLMGAIEFKPNADLHSMVDLYYSHFKQDETRRTFMADLSTWAGPSYSSATTTQFEGNTVVTGGNIVGAHPVGLNTFNGRRDTIKAVGWNTELKLSSWKLVTDLSYSKARRAEQNAELETGVVGPVGFNNVHIPVGPGVASFTPSVNFADATQVYLSDPANWGRDGRSQFPKVGDELKSARIGMKRDLEGMFTSLDVGLNYSDRSKSMDRTEVYYNLKNNRTPVLVPASMLAQAPSMSFAGINTGVLALDFSSALANFYDVVPAALDQAPSREWSVNEKVGTAYARLGLDFSQSLPLRGNLGLQIVHAKQSSDGVNFSDGVGQPVTGGASYTDVLPSLNLIWDVNHNTLLRFAVARVLARPNMEDMKAGFSNASLSATAPHLWSASGSNPALKPWRANAYDISFEKYFSKASYLGIAGFRKDLKSSVYTQDIDFDFTGFRNPTPAVTPTSNIGTLSAPANGKGGFVQGVEATAAVEGRLFHQALDGFGGSLSVSKTASSIHEGNDVSKPLDGLSGTVGVLTAYYEKNGFSARIAKNYRSKFQTTVRGTFGDNVASAILPESTTDAQIGYLFGSGPLKGLSLLAQVTNLTDAPYRTTVGSSTPTASASTVFPERYTTYGRTYLLGVSYKFQ